MLYAILAYHVEAEVMSWTSEQDAALMGKLLKAHERINENSGLGPTARLGETGRALTLRKGTVIDGPFAETKEQLLGFLYAGLRQPGCCGRRGARAATRQSRRGVRDQGDQALHSGCGIAEA